METAAVIVAAGRGERAGPGSGNPKQFRSLAGKPMLQWSIDVLADAGCDPIVLVLPDGFGTHPAHPTRIVTTIGGRSRQESVASGLEEVATERVLVHDAARPFISIGLIEAIVKELDEHDGAIPALPLDETVKRIDNAHIIETISREGLWAVQTPQGFRTDVLRRAHEKARAEGFNGTDESALVERYGGDVKMVRGLRTNVKITYPEDFEFADALARGMQR